MSEPQHVPAVERGVLEPGSADFEWKVMTIPRGISRPDARQLIAEHAEYGRWELARVRLYMGGARRVWMRRKIIRVERTA